MSTLQKSIDSGFNAASTAGDVIKGIDLSGKIAIVTGGYSGIGLETVRALRSVGAKVIVPARDHDKAATALEGIASVEIEAMDLMDAASIDAFAERFLASSQPLHILVNSAGIVASPLARDARGYESQFATNHLGHFQLVTRLWPALRSANGARGSRCRPGGITILLSCSTTSTSNAATMTDGRPMASRRQPTFFSRSRWTSVARPKACALFPFIQAASSAPASKSIFRPRSYGHLASSMRTGSPFSTRPRT